MMFFSVCQTWLNASEGNLKITREFCKETKQIELLFSVSGKNKVMLKLKHSNNKELEKGYDKHLNYLKNNDLEKSFFVVMNFLENENNQLKAIKSNAKDICKIVLIDVAFQNNLQTLELGSNVIEFEGGLLSDKYIQEKRKGGIERHKDTNLIKENVIQQMFLSKQSTSKSIKDISYQIMDELNNLNKEKFQSFANLYSIKQINDVKLAFEYCKKHTDGGQIQNWCYNFKKILSAS